MTVSDSELRDYVTEFHEDLDREWYRERHDKTSFFQELLSEDNLASFEEGDVRELVRNLWAFGSWSNKDYIVNEMLEDGVEDVRNSLKKALYESNGRDDAFDTLLTIPRFGPATASEVLTFGSTQDCAIVNRRAREALAHLGYGDGLPSRLQDGSDYEEYMAIVDRVLKRIQNLEYQGNYPTEIDDYVSFDYFLYYLSESKVDDEVDDPETAEEQEEWSHDEIQEMLLEIGDGLGFDVDDEYHAAPGARIDVRWSTRVANLGKIAYAFEVHHKGHRDSAILNLQKTKNEDPTLQRLIVVSTPKKLNRFEKEIDSISSDFAKSVSYLEIEKVVEASELMANLKEILQAADLME